MRDRNAIEQAYAFFHQKLKVYEHSTFAEDLRQAVQVMGEWLEIQ